MLSKNQIRIIKNLISSNSSVFSEQLAELLEISSRSVKKNVAAINDELYKEELFICSNPHKGYWIEDDQKQKFQSYVYQLEKALLPTDQNQRLILITCRLLRDDRTPSLQKLADDFYISKSTLSADLKYYREICASAKGLQLITNKSGGLSLEGSETARRYLFRVIFYMFLPADKEYIKRCAFRYFGSASLATQIRDILMHSLPEQDIILNDDGLTALTFQIMVSSYRYNRGNYIEPSGKTEKPKWLKKIERCLNIRYDDAEISYYNEQILSFLKYRDDHSSVYQILNGIIDSFFESVQNDYHLNWQNDSSLREKLLDVATYDPLDNLRFIPETTVKDHPFAFGLAKRFNEMLISNGLDHLEESSLDSLTATLAVVLNTQVPKMKTVILTQIEQGHRDYISYRLNTRFCFYLDYLGTYPLYYINNTRLMEQTDFIICTSKHLTDLPSYVRQIDILNKDILYIDPALHYEDFRIIEHYIHDHLPSRCGITIDNEENADEK